MLPTTKKGQSNERAAFSARRRNTERPNEDPAHHRALGDEIHFGSCRNPHRELFDNPDLVYASAIFEKIKPAVQQLKSEFPQAIVGGTGVNPTLRLEDVGIHTLGQDYSTNQAGNKA